MNRNKLRGPVGSRGSWVRFEILALMVLAALVLGVASASSSSRASWTVVVNVIGHGKVTSPSGINCGGGSKTCYLTFSSNTTFTAAADSGWTFDEWGDADTTQSDNGDCDTDTTTTCHETDQHDHVLTANFDGPPTTNGTLSVTYSGDGNAKGGGGGSSEINCGSAGTDCSWTAVQGSTLTVLETPDGGNVFSGWSGDCTGLTVSCTVQLDSLETVLATWTGAAEDTSLLTVTIAGGGIVSGSGLFCEGPAICTMNKPVNATVTLEADPADGYIFAGWTGACTGTTPTCTLSMDAARSVTATFTVAVSLNVSVSGSGNVTGGNGAINCGSGANVCSAAFAQNAVVSLVATAATGAVFTGWTGACGGSTTTCTVSMNQSKDVTATFSSTTAAGFSLSVSVSGSGIVSGGGINCGAGAATCSSGNHTQGSTATLVASPGPGATFAGWGGSCSGTSTTCTVTFTSSLSVSATFTGGGTTPTTAALGVSVTGPGRVSGGGIACGNGAAACSTSVPVGASVVLAETPASGAKFAGWGGACTGTAPTCTVVVTAAKAVSATFTSGAAPGTLTLGVSGRGVVSTSAGKCASTGPAKTCVQHFKAGATPTLTASPAAGQSFLGWSGACSGTKPTCKVNLRTAQSANARFTGRSVSSATLTRVGAPIVLQTSTGYSVTLRFLTTVAGTARVRAVRAGRPVTTVAAKVGAGRVRVGPFPVPLGGLYTFEIRLAGSLLKMRACLGTCGAAAPPPPFLLFREPPTVTRTGDAWSVTLHTRSNQIYDGRLRATRPGRVLVNQHFLGQAGRTAFGPFLLGPGNYTLTLTGVDAYGRTRTVVWVVSLA